MPKRIMEEGGSIKIGFSVSEGWLVETTAGYAPLAMTEDYRAALDALGIEDVTRIQFMRDSYCTDGSDYPLAVIKSVNSQSFIPQDNKLVLTDLWAASAIKRNAENFVLGKEYTFTLNSTGTYNNLSADVQPADAYLYFFSSVVGDVGWNANGKKGPNTYGGIYVSVTPPAGEKKLLASHLTSWGHPGSPSIVFSFENYGKNVLEIRIATNTGYTVIRTLEINVAPAIVVEGDVTVSQGYFTAPAHKLIGATDGTELPVSSASVKLTYNGGEIAKQGGVYPSAGAGKYVLTYASVFEGTEYTYDYGFYYDGETIMSKEITPNFMFTDHAIFQKGKKIKVFGTGGNVGATVAVEYDGQTKTGTVDEYNTWEVYLDEMDYNNGKTLKITYGAQVIEYADVAVGEVFLCSGQSNMQISVNYIASKDETVPADYTSLGDNFENIRIFSVSACASSQKQTGLSASTSWVKPAKYTDLGRYSAYAVAFAQNLQAMSGVKVGVVIAAIGGTSIEEWLEADSFNRVVSHSAALGRANTESRYFNGMIYPVSNYEIGGILWYQGESNSPVAAAKDYPAQFLEYASSYRRLFRDENLKIVTTQLVQYAREDFTYMREMQWKTMFEGDNIYTVCAIDTGDFSGGNDSIHPSDKWKVGEKAAGLAASEVLGIAYDDLLYKASYGVAPYIKKAVLKDGVLTLTVENASALKKSEGENSGLEIFAEDKWQSAGYVLNGTSLVVNTNGKEVSKIRYLQSRIIEAGTAVLTNEYGNALAPCYSLDVSDGKVYYRYSVTVNGLGAVLPVEGTVEAGQSVEISAAPAAGYEIEKVLADGATVTVKDGVITLSNAVKDVTVNVYFKAVAGEGGNQGGEDGKSSGCKSSVLQGAAAISLLGFAGAFIGLKGRRKHG
ncbi:MAG: sialate O-acetylesterase [Candidatus Scatosoma sp.]